MQQFGIGYCLIKKVFVKAGFGIFLIASMINPGQYPIVYDKLYRDFFEACFWVFGPYSSNHRLLSIPDFCT